MKKVKVALMRFLLQPILNFKNEFEQGDIIFQDLFYARTESKSEVNFALEKCPNLTIVGNPGEGKTCLMHYMFVEAKKNSLIFPIILDYSLVKPRSIYGMIAEFVSGMKMYFLEIEEPIQLAEETTDQNYTLHFRLVSSHLEKISNDKLKKKKKLAIFLDDLDYMDKMYMQFLKDYFIAYAKSDKAIVILSGRKPLFNSIACDDELRQSLRIKSKVIFLQKLDIQNLINARIKAFLREYEYSRFESVFSFRRNPITIEILKREFLKKYKAENGEDPISDNQDIYKVDLGFNDSFFVYLSDITGRNIRDMEEILPMLYEFHMNNANNPINFNTNFCDSYVLSTCKDRNYLLDIVSEKTGSRGKTKNGNSYAQIVLEYFMFNSMVDEKFYLTMEDYGITRELADATIEKLSKSPYSLLEPDYIYELGNPALFRNFKLNSKGKIYLTNIINRPIYYEKLGATKSKRSYLEDNEKKV